MLIKFFSYFRRISRHCNNVNPGIPLSDFPYQFKHQKIFHRFNKADLNNPIRFFSYGMDLLHSLYVLKNILRILQAGTPFLRQSNGMRISNE